MFKKSQEIKNEFNDDFYISEILLYTLLCCKGVDIYDQLTKIGIKKDKLKEIILKLRKGQTINSHSKSIDLDSLKNILLI